MYTDDTSVINIPGCFGIAHAPHVITSICIVCISYQYANQSFVCMYYFMYIQVLTNRAEPSQRTLAGLYRASSRLHRKSVNPCYNGLWDSGQRWSELQAYAVSTDIQVLSTNVAGYTRLTLLGE